MTFGEALEKAKQGAKIQRSGWNGKGMFVSYSPGMKDLPALNFWGDAIREYVEQNGGKADIRPYLILKMADGTITLGWTPNTPDVISNDWEVIE